MCANYKPYHEEITGADLTGSNGESNRTYTLANDNAVAAMMQIARDGAFLQQGIGYTFDSSTNTVTFLAKVWDSQVITLDYNVDEEVTVSGTIYCTTLQVARYAGIGVAIELENLGTGDNSNDSFDLDNGNVLAGSYTVKYGASDSNNLNTMTESTDYTLDKDSGSLVLTSAGVTKLGKDVLYISYTYSTGQSDTVLSTYLEPASREVDKLTWNYWGTNKTSYEYFDGYDSGYPQTDEPFGTQIESYPEFRLKYGGVSSITSVLFLDREGNTDTTLDSDDYRIITDDDMQESRLLINKTIPNGKANVKVTYVHGYSSVPALIQELTALVAGVMSFVNVTGGSYDAITSWTIGRKGFTQGEQWVNIREVLSQMKARIDSILEHYGRNYACV